MVPSRVFFTILRIFPLVLGIPLPPDTPGTAADTILFGGKILTMDEANPVAEAVAIYGETIIDVGSVDKVFRYRTWNTNVIFLNQQTLMPGFIEPHQHAIQSALMRSLYVNIGAHKYRSFKEIRQVMKATIDEIQKYTSNDMKWGIFVGWDPELISDLPILCASFLDDTFSSTLPIVVIAQSLHVAWANSPALSLGGINKDTPNPTGGVIVKDADGIPTGQLMEVTAIRLVLDWVRTLDTQTTATAFRAQWRAYAAAGFTTVTDLAYTPSKEFNIALKATIEAKDSPVRLGLYRIIDAVKDENCYTAGQTTPTPLGADVTSDKAKHIDMRPEEGIGNSSCRLWEAGVKLWADGSPHAGTAATREPYLNTPLTDILGFPAAPGYGNLIIDTDALYDTVRRHHLQGAQVAIHCHGERSSEQVLRVFEQLLEEYPSTVNRHRMEHLGLTTVEQIARAGKLDLALSFFVDHLRFYASTYKTDILGERVNRWAPLAAATKNNVTWTIHQDHPGLPGEPSPFANMKTAITRTSRDDPSTSYGPEFRVSIHEALKAYTINAAWQLRVEDLLGSITVGKKADLVVLSENPYDVDPFQLERIKVVETFMDGRRTNLAQVKEVPYTSFQALDCPY